MGTRDQEVPGGVLGGGLVVVLPALVAAVFGDAGHCVQCLAVCTFGACSVACPGAGQQVRHACQHVTQRPRPLPQVVCSSAGPLGTLFLDLCSRPGKYPGSVLFPIRCGRALPGGAYQQPTLALVCDFGSAEGEWGGRGVPGKGLLARMWAWLL